LQLESGKDEHVQGKIVQRIGHLVLILNFLLIRVQILWQFELLKWRRNQVYEYQNKFEYSPGLEVAQGPGS
jgi:hypothetical protein